ELGGSPQRERRDRRENDRVKLLHVAQDYCAYKQTRIRANSFANLHHLLVGPLPDVKHKTWKKKRNTDSWLKPFHGRPAHTITKTDVSLVLKHAETVGKPTAKALRSNLSSMFAWAI